MASSKLLLVYTKCQVTIVPYLDADQIPKELGYESSQLRESMLRIKNKWEQGPGDGAIFRDGDRVSRIPGHLRYGTSLLFLEQIAPPWWHVSARIRAHVVDPRVDVVMLPWCVIKWWEFEDSRADLSQRWQGIRIRTRGPFLESPGNFSGP